MSVHKIISDFNPDVVPLGEEHQDFLQEFSAGSGFENFDDFIHDEAYEYAKEGNGATYLVFDNVYDESRDETNKVLVSYFTLATTTIPYEDVIKLDKEEAEKRGEEYDRKKCGIPALEIKMFAVDVKYQDSFFEDDESGMPISAWILRMIIAYAYTMMETIVGFKALFLHAVPSAVEFYRKNHFFDCEKYMSPFYSMEDDYQAMYLPFHHVHINQEDEAS